MSGGAYEALVHECAEAYIAVAGDVDLDTEHRFHERLWARFPEVTDKDFERDVEHVILDRCQGLLGDEPLD